MDTENLPLWRAAGLPLDEGGFLIDSTLISGSPGNQQRVDEMIVYGIMRLLCRVVNFCATGPIIDNDTTNRPDGTAEQRHAAWNNLVLEFDARYNSLPPSFRSEFSISSRGNSNESPANYHEIFSTEDWYPNPICAVGMAYYYMARMLLIIQRPGFTGPRQRHADPTQPYRALQDELRGYANQIFAIAAGNTIEGVRIRLVQPLYVAGRCLVEPHDGKALIKMLRGINEELGISTAYRVKDLHHEWRTSEEAMDEIEGSGQNG